MKVTVVSVRGLHWRERHEILYVGRGMPSFGGHALANPFKVSKSSTLEERRDCIAQYEHWLDSHPERDRLLSELAAMVKSTGCPLGCWCGNWPENPNLICHAVVLAKRVQAILEAR